MVHSPSTQVVQIEPSEIFIDPSDSFVTVALAASPPPDTNAVNAFAPTTRASCAASLGLMTSRTVIPFGASASVFAIDGATWTKASQIDWTMPSADPTEFVPVRMMSMSWVFVVGDSSAVSSV